MSEKAELSAAQEVREWIRYHLVTLNRRALEAFQSLTSSHRRSSTT